jgi:hypothetical protein
MLASPFGHEPLPPGPITRSTHGESLFLNPAELPTYEDSKPITLLSSPVVSKGTMSCPLESGVPEPIVVSVA